jgi:hypothetical protein
MAKIQIKLPEDFHNNLTKLEAKTDQVLPKVVEEGGKVALSAVRSALSGAIGHSLKYKKRSTGELASSLGLAPAKQDFKGDWNVKVGFPEPRSDGKVNAKLANIIEHGKHGQPARPFLKRAKSQSRAAVLEAMKEKLLSEVELL